MTGFSLTENVFISYRVTVTPCNGIQNLGNFSLGIWNEGQVLWIPLIIEFRNPSSIDKESGMRYPWSRIENPRVSDFLAWADHCFQLDKIKDIMCFHYFIFATRKKSHKLQTLMCKFFISEKRKQFIFPMSLYLAVFYCQWNEQIIINYHYCDTKNWINEKSGLKYQRI